MGVETEIDFSSGERGKLFRPDAEMRVPIYLDAEVEKSRSDARAADDRDGAAGFVS